MRPSPSLLAQIGRLATPAEASQVVHGKAQDFFREARAAALMACRSLSTGFAGAQLQHPCIKGFPHLLKSPVSRCTSGFVVAGVSRVALGGEQLQAGRAVLSAGAAPQHSAPVPQALPRDSARGETLGLLLQLLCRNKQCCSASLCICQAPGFCHLACSCGSGCPRLYGDQPPCRWSTSSSTRAGKSLRFVCLLCFNLVAAVSDWDTEGRNALPADGGLAA